VTPASRVTTNSSPRRRRRRVGSSLAPPLDNLRSNVSRRSHRRGVFDGDQFEDQSRRHVAGDQFLPTRRSRPGRRSQQFAIANSSKSPSRDFHVRRATLIEQLRERRSSCPNHRSRCECAQTGPATSRLVRTDLGVKGVDEQRGAGPWVDLRLERFELTSMSQPTRVTRSRGRTP